jgi:Tfp pilus assembly protein FimV
MASINAQELRRLLRTELPELLAEDPGLRDELVDLLGIGRAPAGAPADSGDTVWDVLRELAAAQASTDATVKELANEVKELASEVKALAAAQASTDQSLKALRKEVGALSENVGFGLEELAAIILPGVLLAEEGLRAPTFRRRFVLTAEGEEEVDLFAEAERDGAPVTVIGEVKSRIYDKEVRRFVSKASRLETALGLSGSVRVMFGFVVHPLAREVAAELGVHVVASRPG